MLMKEERDRPVFKDLLKSHFFYEEYPEVQDDLHNKMEVSPCKFERREEFHHY